MKEIQLRFDVALDRRFLCGAAAAAMMLAAVPELDSESVTLSTVYPAPSGVYTRLIATNETSLARDQGTVGIGLAGAAPVTTDFPDNETVKLDVRGGISLANDSNISFGHPSAPNARFTVIGVNSLNQLRMGDVGNVFGGVQFHAGGSQRMFLDPNGQLGIGTGAPGHMLDVAGSAQASYFVTTTATGNSCVETQYMSQGVTPCPPGNYATLTSGVIAKYTITADQGTGQVGFGNMLCCPCPGGPLGCPL